MTGSSVEYPITNALLETGLSMDGPNWDEAVAHHGLESLLYSEWNTNACHKVAPERLQRLKNSARIAAFNEALKEKRLLEVLSNLAQAGVEPLLIKGSALAYFVYDAPHHRFRNDTDLMIPMSAISRARGVLESLGYRVDGPMYKSHQYTAVDTRAVHGSEQNLDIHWRISNHSRFARVLEYTECLTRAELIDIGGTRVKGLGAVDSLLLACIHRFGNSAHDRNRLIWLLDIHKIINKMDEVAQIDFAKTAVARKVGDVCLDGVNQATRFFGTKVSKDALLTLSSCKGVEKKNSRGAYLMLYLADFLELPGFTAKQGLLRELLSRK